MNSGNGIVTALVVGFYNTYIAILANPPASTMTSGRARSIVAGGVGVVSLILGVVALPRGPPVCSGSWSDHLSHRCAASRSRPSQPRRQQADGRDRRSSGRANRHRSQCDPPGYLHWWFRYGQRACRGDRGTGAGADRHNSRRSGSRTLPPFGQRRVIGGYMNQTFIKGLWGVRYQVKDVKRSIDFYTTQLGLKLDMQVLPAFGQVSVGNLKLILSGPGASGSRQMPDGREQEPGGWNRIILQVDDLAARIENLKKAGLRFRNEMEVGPGGKQVQLEDPDGNPIELFQPAPH